MDDRMLHEYRREPDPRFANDLRERLRGQEASRRLAARRTGRIVAGLAAAAAVTVVFAVPSVRVSAQALLDQLDLKDVKVPAGLDGQWVELRKPPVVVQRFRSERRRAILLQARSPEVVLPAGWNLEQLGEIGLRILGLDAGEAKRIAKATDWRSTLLVPLPMDATSFRQVTVRGQSGLLITTKGEKAADGKHHREGTILMWSEGDRIFCLQGNFGSQELIQMAESVS